MKLLQAKNVYMVGIKGVAMTSLALCLKDMGINISGSDVLEDFVTADILKANNFKIFVDFSADHITPDIDLVIYTGAHQGSHNTEVLKANELGITTLSQAEALGELTSEKKLVSICGTGGKSTTSAMLAWILDSVGESPSFTVGAGNVANFGFSGRFDPESAWFVAEADEYAVDPTSDKRPRFVYQHPKIIVCTNLKYDHPDVYPNLEATKSVFMDFFNTLPDDGVLVVNGDDLSIQSIVGNLKTKARVIKVGKNAGNDYQILETKSELGISVGEIKSLDIFTLKLEIPGEFNLMNAVMALVVALKIGADREKALRALENFKGVMRRFEKKGKVNGADWYDDYAHTPDEIASTLKALRSWYKDYKIEVVFQPHTYSRTKALFADFSGCFTDADDLILLPIFASARESADVTISSELLADSILKRAKHPSVEVMESFEDVSKALADVIDKNSVVITLGAGDVYKVFEYAKKTL